MLNGDVVKKEFWSRFQIKDLYTYIVYV